MPRFNKFLLGAAALATPALSLAADPDAFDTALASLQTGMTGTIDKIVPVVAAVVVAAVALWAIPFAWKKLRGGAGR